NAALRVNATVGESYPTRVTSLWVVPSHRYLITTGDIAATVRAADSSRSRYCGRLITAIVSRQHKARSMPHRNQPGAQQTHDRAVAPQRHCASGSTGGGGSSERRRRAAVLARGGLWVGVGRGGVALGRCSGSRR